MRYSNLQAGAAICWRDAAGFIHQGQVVFVERHEDGSSAYCVEFRVGTRWAVHPMDIVEEVRSAAAASARSFP